jgi:hypothetical protein
MQQIMEQSFRIKAVILKESIGVLSDIYNGEVLNGWLLDCLPRFWLLHF